jgi:hypothetical protein
MAEMNPMNRLRKWSLEQASMHGQLIAVTCKACRVTHRYYPSDLIRLRGNMDLATLSVRCTSIDTCG